MAFIKTTFLLEQLAARLKELPLRADDVAGSDKLFQRVGYFGANRLGQALRATFASEDRVAFIVPAGVAHSGGADAVQVSSRRAARFALILADRAFDEKKEAAVVGGPSNPGILEMAERVIDNLFDEPFATPDLAFAPGEGEPLVIEGKDNAAGAAGREAYLLWLTAYAGQRRAAVPH